MMSLDMNVVTAMLLPFQRAPHSLIKLPYCTWAIADGQAVEDERTTTPMMEIAFPEDEQGKLPNPIRERDLSSKALARGRACEGLF